MYCFGPSGPRKPRFRRWRSKTALCIASGLALAVQPSVVARSVRVQFRGRVQVVMAKWTEGSTSEGVGVTSFDDVRVRMSGFGAWVAGLDVSHLEGSRLHEVVAMLAAVDAQVAVRRSNVLAAIESLGGDPVDAQKKHGRASHSASNKNADTAAALKDLPAAKKTSAADVNGDATLLGRVESQDEDRAKQTRCADVDNQPDREMPQPTPETSRSADPSASNSCDCPGRKAPTESSSTRPVNIRCSMVARSAAAPTPNGEHS
ncbi:MAG: hypothetical protein ACI81L_000433 [Verrucomicrobiales bacterium]|jgi:hypothetical protein